MTGNQYLMKTMLHLIFEIIELTLSIKHVYVIMHGSNNISYTICYTLWYLQYFKVCGARCKKVFCASSCRTLHWIVLPSSIDLHYPHTVNKRTYSLSLSFPMWMCWIALTEIHHKRSQNLMRKRVCDKMCRLSVPLRHFWIECSMCYIFLYFVWM